MNQNQPQNYNLLCHEVNEKIKKLRNIQYLIDSQLFKTVYDKADIEQKKAASILIKDCDKDNLQVWLRNNDDKALGEKPWSELSKIAKSHNVKNYSRLTKPQLIGAILKCK